jgi:uncharacterized protein (TIGR01244 family)
MLTRLIRIAAVLIASPILAEDNPAQPAKPKLEAAKCGSVKQLHVLGDIYLAGQPSPEDFQEFQKRGVKTVLNLRAPEEMTFDEAKTLKDLGLKYHHIPISTPESLSDENFEKLRKVLNEKSDRPLLFHCASANRVGAVWLAHRVLDDGIAYDMALAEAKTVGLKATALEAKAKDYIARQQAKKPARPERKTDPQK